MIEDSMLRLGYLVQLIPALLLRIPESEFENKAKPEKWSKKEILGHLIDSATNNHHRFVRTQFENKPSISYMQDGWVKYNAYQQSDTGQLISFWTLYNKQLLTVIKNIPPQNLSKVCNTGGENDYTLAFLIDDYVVHLEHHLHQIVNY